jgi:hypothetical protein
MSAKRRRGPQHVEVIEDGAVMPLSPAQARAHMEAQYERSELVAVVLRDPLLGGQAVVHVIADYGVAPIIEAFRSSIEQLERSQRGH